MSQFDTIYKEDRVKNEDTFFSYTAKMVDKGRKGLGGLIKYAVDNGFLTAPASMKYHLNCEGGLLKHSLNVLNQLELLDNVYDIDIQPEPDTLFICGMFHDIHKCCDGFGQRQYGEEKRDWHKKNVSPYEWNNNQFAFNSEMKSILIMLKFIDLRQDELQAIGYHSLGFHPDVKSISNNVYPLTVVLHMADMYASNIIETKKSIDEGKLFLKENLEIAGEEVETPAPF